MPHVLVIGGHGKIAQYFTRVALSKSWTVTSMIRAAEQKPTIEKLGESQPGELHVLLSSVEEVRTGAQARSVIDAVRPDWVVWSAGAGGKGGAERTKAVDEVACKRFVSAALAAPFVTKFLLVSYTGSRRAKPAWWDDAQWKQSLDVNAGVLANYFKAKVAADEYFYSAFLHAKRERQQNGKGKEFAAIDLRPGTLTEDDDETIELGRTPGTNSIGRRRVAEVAVALLGSAYKGGYVDLTKGKEPWQDAVERVATEGVDAFEGEDLSAIAPLYDQDVHHGESDDR